MLIENVDYMFTFNTEDDSHYAVKILKGDYEGVVYYYKTISAKESDDRLEAILNYTYKVLVDPGEIIVNKKDFETHIGDILTSVIYNINNSPNPAEHFEVHEQTRNDNTSKLVEQ